MKSDSEIANSKKLLPIQDIARKLYIPDKYLIPYGKYIAKIHSDYIKDLQNKQDGKLILVTSMTPTAQGEGKTTITIGIAQAFAKLGKNVMACIRQPSLGPFLGAKGGATGSGYSQVLPVEDISLYFTGDDHAVTTANNLISSIIDNHLYHGNKLEIDSKQIFWNRVSNINDRALRKIKVGLVKKEIERAEEFHISSASEIMSILCLTQDLRDLKKRIGNIILAVDKNGEPVLVKDLNIQGAATLLLKNAIHPNLVQSVEGAPIFVHGGTFGNVSLGCNSLIATKMALKLSDYILTEAGFAADLGAEKFFNITCRMGNLKPQAVVIVATLKALQYHSRTKNYESGIENLEKHIENIQKFGLPMLVALNRFSTDEDKELNDVVLILKNKGIPAFVVDVRNKGGKGGIAAAKEIIKLCGEKNKFKYLYPLNMPVKEKIKTIAEEIYGAKGVEFTKTAEKDISNIEDYGYKNLPVCIAKTPKSLSDNPELLGRPKDFNISVQRILPAIGAGFLVAICGNILLMPGLPEHPLAEKIDVDEYGRIIGI